MPSSCPFCSLPDDRVVWSSDLVVAVRDAYPVSPGHTLLIPRRHLETYFDANALEQSEIWRALAAVKAELDASHHPAGYNIGFNAGTAAGQTVAHAHVHVIPRFTGDMDDPSGGVRHVIPTKGNYRRNIRPLASGGPGDPFSAHIFPLFNSAHEIAILAAFVQETGLDHIEEHVRDAVARGAHVRVLTGDYLDITQARALELLLLWERTTGTPDDDDDVVNDNDARPERGTFEARIIEVDRLAGTRAFHPKSWRFEAASYGIAFVGSSNLSRSALETGIEWNLRVDRDRDADAYERVRDAFDEVWIRARKLDADWIARYAERARVSSYALPPGEAEAELLEEAPPPHKVQVEALAKLKEARAQGWRRALVVLATGLGKTWLAAFDHQQMHVEIGAPPRLLFLAHRKELLHQAAKTYRRALRANGAQARIGWCLGGECDLSAELVFASVAKLARREHLAKLAGERFDYVVVDEVHHAAAGSYRKILDVVDPRFLLGLTATPDRADAADILGLFDDHIAYRANIDRGIEIEQLVPFHYFGVKDDIDYENLPWRNRRFDPEQLAEAAQTEARMTTMWRAWNEHPGGRTLVFCCSIVHANFVRAWLDGRGVRTRVVYAGEGSDDRAAALRELGAGKIDALCSVDVFNEGVDVPSVDRVVMLRPTESSVIFLQQLGRGLRASTATGKTTVTVIDFVGNHRIFLERLRTLLSLAGRDAPQLRPLLLSTDPIDMPSGCSVDLELEAKEMLSNMFRGGAADEVESIYRELAVERGERPSAGELERMRYLPSRLRERHTSWFDFVQSEGHLDAKDEVQKKNAFTTNGAFLRDIETSEMTKCFKMITLEALIEADALRTGMPLRDLALRSHAILRRSPDLFAEVTDDARMLELDAAAEKKWIAYWRKNPIEAWTASKKVGRAWFRVEGDRFTPTFAVPAAEEAALVDLTREIVDYRLAQYRARRRREDVSSDDFVCKVLWNKRDPILKLPSRTRAQLPEGETDVRVGGEVWQFRFAKEFCNVARRAGNPTNQLPDLMRRWFGPSAGKPGTSFDVRFERSPDGLWAVPVQDATLDLPQLRGVVTYPDLRAAAGRASEAVEPADAARVMLPIETEDAELFAVRVSGTSMDGGKQPMRDGDWAIMRLARSAPASALENRVVLIQVPSASFGSQYQIKRLRKHDGHWQLASDNPEGPTFDTTEDSIPIARLERSVRPEDLGPSLGTVLSESELAAAFGLAEIAPASGRHGGHLFIFIDKKGMLVAPDRVSFASEPQRPGETAFVVAARSDGAFRYLGVGRWLESESRWLIPDVDFTTWRAWGDGRETSRALPEGALLRAQVVVDAVLALPEEERWLVRPNGYRARVLGRADRGGFRVDGGDGGFGERTVSLTDLAWVLTADDVSRESGALLDEPLVNRVRYLDGTPKGSTRWVDTGWALAAWSIGKGLVRDAAGAAFPPGRKRAGR